jgi:hypothetical protein
MSSSVPDTRAAANPYAPPKVEAVIADTPAEIERRAHINHEASIKAIGRLYILGGIIGAALVVATALNQTSDALAMFMVGALMIASGAVGWGVVKLHRWARFPATALALLGLLGFPFGTLINAYFLWLLWGTKGRRIFREDYPDIVAATPDIKYRTSKIVWFFLVLLVLFFAAIVAISIMR